VPLIDGRAVFDGGDGGGGGAAVTGPTAALVAGVDPPALVAVTLTVIVWPTSPADSVSVFPVVPSDHKYE
jgi:hypothetical protein